MLKGSPVVFERTPFPDAITRSIAGEGGRLKKNLGRDFWKILEPEIVSRAVV